MVQVHVVMTSSGVIYFSVGVDRNATGVYSGFVRAHLIHAQLLQSDR